jgi:hypothetical protein
MDEAILTLSEALDRAKAREPLAQLAKSNGWTRRAPKRREAAYALAPLTPTTGQMGARPMTEATNAYT